MMKKLLIILVLLPSCRAVNERKRQQLLYLQYQKDSLHIEKQYQSGILCDWEKADLLGGLDDLNEMSGLKTTKKAVQ